MKAITNARVVFPDRIEEGSVLIADGKIVAAGKVYVPSGCECFDAGGLYVGPGLIDQHVHGYSSDERLDVIEDTRRVAALHLKHGTTTITPSCAYSATQEDFLSIIEQCNEAIDSGDTTIAGIHFEGPFINPARGANSHLAWQFSEELCDKIFAAAGKNVLHCTYAPEMPFGEQVEAALEKYGVRADIGHTNADEASVMRAYEKGARIATHLFDAMGASVPRPFLDQNYTTDILLSLPDMYYELICDSRCVHVSAVSQKQTLKNAGEDYIILISDCTGRKTVLNRADYPPEDMRSAADLNFNLSGQLSGSSLTVSQSAANFKRTTGADMRTVFKCASTNSAKALGLFDRVGSVEPGKDANLVMVDESFTVKAVWFRGEAVEEVRF